MRVTTGSTPVIPACRPSTTHAHPTAQPVQDLRKKAKTYIPPAEELASPNRQQRRQQNRWQWHQWHPLAWVGIVLFAVALLYWLGCVACSAYIAYCSDPAHFGPEHGNVLEVPLAGQQYYVQGMNNDGEISVLVVPTEHLDKAHLIAIATGASKDDVVDLEQATNGEIIVHVEGKPYTLWFRGERKYQMIPGKSAGQYTTQEDY